MNLAKLYFPHFHISPYIDKINVQAFSTMKFQTKSLAETKKIAQKILQLLSKHNLNTVAFTGDLGTGKTTITQLIGKELKIKKPIQSPTYVLMREYEISPSKKSPFNKLIHIDAYRLGPKDTEIFDLPELFADKTNLVMIEWANRIKNALPQKYLDVNIKFDGKKRIFKVSPTPIN